MQNQNLGDVQAQAAAQMQSQAGDNGMREASQHISQAAKTMTQSNMTQVHQTNMLIQAMQQQQSQLAALTASVSASMAGQNMVPPPMPPPPMPMPAASSSFDNLASSMRGLSARVGDYAKVGLGYAAAGYGAVAPMVAAHASRFHQNVQMMSNAYNPFSGVAQHSANMGFGGGGAPGILQSSSSGVFTNAYRGMGILYNAHMSQSTNYGHMQDAQFRAMGHGISDQMYGAAHGVLGMGSAEKAAGWLGGAAGSTIAAGIGGRIGGALLGTAVGGPVGGLVGGMLLGPLLASAGAKAFSAVGKPLDKINPLMLAYDLSTMGVSLGEGANSNAGRFLRGGGSASRPGQFTSIQQGMLGRGLARDSLADLTFGSSDYSQMQTMFNEAGLNRGVQSASQYRSNFRRRMQDAREIMKTFNLTIEEATQFMDIEYNQLGLGPGRSDMRSRMVAAAHMSGKSPMQIAQIAAHGVQGAVGLGLMSGFGAGTAVSADGLAGMATIMGARGQTGLGEQLLTTIGGEQGLQAMIQQQVLRFAAGTGGTLMALGGGGFGTDVMGGISRAGQGLTNDRIIGFMANRHKELSAQSPEMMQYQHFSYIRGIAQQMSGMGGTEEERMRLIAQSEGLSPAEADALIEAGKSLRSSGIRSARIQSNNIVDQHRDIRTEQFGFKGRVERWLRNTGATKGLIGSIDYVGGAADRTGAVAKNTLYDLYNRFIGIDEISGYSYDTMVDAMNVDGHELVADPVSAEESRRLQESARRRRAAIAASGKGTDSMSELRRLSGTYDIHKGVSANEATLGGANLSISATGLAGPLAPVVGAVSAWKLTTHSTDSAGRRLGRAITGDLESEQIRSLVGDVMGISASDVTGEDIRFVMEMEGANERTVRRTLDELGMDYEARTIKSTKDIAKAGRELFLGKGYKQVVKDHIMMTAMGSSEFKRIMELLSQASQERKEGPESEQSSAYRQIKAQIKKEIANIEDPAVQEVVERILQAKGISVSVSGDLDFTNAPTTLFGDNWEEDHSVIRGDITAKSRVDYMEKGLSGFVGGEDNARIILDDRGRIQNREALEDALSRYADLDPDELARMTKEGTDNEKVIAAAIHKVKGGRRLTDADLQAFGTASLAHGARVGNVVKSADGKVLDENMMSTETIKALETTNQALAATHQMLELLAKDAGIITRSTSVGQAN